jgi:hypothetical protein
MVCPSCGAQIDGHGKFCAVCGAQLPEAAAPPPAWSQPVALPPAPPPAAYNAPQYAPPPAPYAAPQYGAPPPPPYGPPGYGAPQYGAPAYGGGTWGAPYAASRPGGSAPLAGLLALAGGAAAVASAWLPWATFMDTSTKLIDSTDTSRLECGYYLVAGGAIAAVCGLLLLMRTGSLQLFGLGALAGGILVVVVEVMTYNQVNQFSDLANLYGGSAGISYGIGFYLGIGAGVVGALGGLAGLVSRR